MPKYDLEREKKGRDKERKKKKKRKKATLNIIAKNYSELIKTTNHHTLRAS